MMLNIKFAPEVNNLLATSKEEALRLYNDKVTPTHLLLSILKQAGGHALEILHQLDADVHELKDKLEESARKMMASSPFSTDDLVLDPAASRVMKLSVLESRVAKSESIEVEHVLLAILKRGDCVPATPVSDNQNPGYDYPYEDSGRVDTQDRRYE